MSKSNALRVQNDTPLLLRRVTTKPSLPNKTLANMTVCTSGGSTPEMSDQVPDATAPRHDS